MVALLLAVVLPALASAGTHGEAVGLRFSAPEGWRRVQTTSPLIAAQFRIPRVRKDKQDGDLVLFQFGTAKGGGVADNVERWYAQITQPDGRPSREAAVVTTRKVNGLTVTVVDVAGTYRPQLGPLEHTPSPGYRLLGAAVEGEGGPWFWRAVGPAATMARAKVGFDALIESLDVSR